jgi:hypothetical protein
MSGPPQILVDKDSATQSRPWETSDRYIMSINRSHSDLVKFSKHDHEYEIVLDCLRDFLQAAPRVIAKRL